MLPSRGVFRSSPTIGLQRIIPSATPRSLRAGELARAGAPRRFGTSLQRNDSIFGIAAGGTLGGRRIAGLMPITAVVTRQHHLSRPGQTRHASTQAEVVPSAEISPTSLELDGSSLMNLPEQIGYLHAMGLDYGWGPTSAMQWVLEHVHVYGGLPWWGSIALTAVLIRVAIFKPSLTASEHSAKMAELRKNPRYNQIAETMQRATFEPGLKIDTMALRNEMRMMNKAAGLQLWRTFVPLVNLPIGIGMFRLLRGMAALPIPGLEHGGFLWFTDLTVADPLFILPLASAGVMFYIMKLNLPFVPPQNRAMMKGIAYVLTPLSLVVTLSLPAGLQWFFLVSAFLQFLQSWLYKQPWLRRWANLGPLPQTVEPRPNPPPYTQPSAGKWVAPRTISTTSRPAAPNAGDENMTMAGFVSGIRDGWKSAKTRMNNYTERSGKKEDGRKAQEYEQKRTLEEQEKFYARREARSEKKRKL